MQFVRSGERLCRSCIDIFAWDDKTTIVQHRFADGTIELLNSDIFPLLDWSLYQS